MNKIMITIVLLVSLLCMGCGETVTTPIPEVGKVVVKYGDGYPSDYVTEVMSYSDWQQWKKNWDCSGYGSIINIMYANLGVGEIYYEWGDYDWNSIDLCN